MDAATISYANPPAGSADVAYGEHDSDPPNSPDKLPASVIARRRITAAGALGSPVRRSPRLSRPLPPQPPVEFQDTSSGDESVNDVALHLSREDTPENDTLLLDEPSTVLANRILRASDNPSPPPLDLAHPGVNYDRRAGQSSSRGISPPPSPLRPMDQLSASLVDSSRIPPSPASHDLPGLLESNSPLKRNSISPEYRSPFDISAPTKVTSHKDLESADIFPLPSTQSTVADLPLLSPQHVHDAANFAADTGVHSSSPPASGLQGKPTTMTSSFDSETSGPPPKPTVHPPLDRVALVAVDVCSGEIPSSSGIRSSPESPHLVSSTPTSSNGNYLLLPTGILVASQDNDGKESLPLHDIHPSGSKELQENECKKGAGADLHRTSDSLSSLSLNILTDLSAESVHIEQPPATPPQRPRPPAMRFDSPRTTVQRLIVAPTPLRANTGTRKLLSPAKHSSEVDACRTPAQRVPIETVFAHGTSSLQKTIQLSTGLDHSQPGRFPMIRSLIFTRPELDDPSRSPAKRVPITGPAISPERCVQDPSSAQTGLRARSASVEPRPLGPILARSRSVEPCPAIPKPDGRDKIKESIFPAVPIPSRSGTKLPFPLIPSQKLSSVPSLPILEENEIAEKGNTETDALLNTAAQGAMSQLRQPSVNCRIPRIGNKLYARPSSNSGKTRGGTTTTATRAHGIPFQFNSKNSIVKKSNMEMSSAQHVSANDQRLVGSLKRKRGVETATPSVSHPVKVRQVVPGILSEKYAVRPATTSSQVLASSKSSPPKATQPLKFRKVVDGMLSARYAHAKANLSQMELLDSTSGPPSPLSEISSSSTEEPSDETLAPTTHSRVPPKSETSDSSRADVAVVVTGPSTFSHSSSYQNIDGGEPRPRRTSRTRKPAQQQYVLDVFSNNTSIRAPPARRKPQSRTEGDGFMGISATALKALTTSNTTKNQQTIVVLATEVIRKEGLRPESPTVKARTILQKQRDERDMRRRERAHRKARMSEEGLGSSDSEGLGDRISLGGRANHDENDCGSLQKHRRGPGEDEDYETPERLGPLRLEKTDDQAKPAKQVKWHRGLSTAVYLDEIDPKPKLLPKNVVVRGCLAPTSKNLPLDSLGNLVDIDNRPSPELVAEQIIVKKYLYENDIEPEPIPAKMTRSRSKKSRN